MSLCKNWCRTFSADAISCYQQPCSPQITYKKKEEEKTKNVYKQNSGKSYRKPEKIQTKLKSLKNIES